MITGESQIIIFTIIGIKGFLDFEISFTISVKIPEFIIFQDFYQIS